MQLHLESRPVGDVLVIQCQGRIVGGKEVFTLHSYVGDSFVKYGDGSAATRASGVRRQQWTGGRWCA